MASPADLPLADRLKRLRIIEPEADIAKMSAAELAELFPHSTGVNDNRLIKSLIWQDYKGLKSGAYQPPAGNIRSYFYQRLLPVFSQVTPDSETAKDRYNLMLRSFSLMVLEYRLFNYRDWGFRSSLPGHSGIGFSLPQVLVLSEKTGRLHLLQKLHDDYGVSYIANRGQPSALNTEQLLDDFRAADFDLGRELLFIPIVDFDPSGHEIAQNFLYQLRRLGYQGPFTRIDVIHPKFVTRSFLRENLTNVSTAKNQRKKLVRWLAYTGGGLQPYNFGRTRGFQADAMIDEMLEPIIVDQLQPHLDKPLAEVNHRQLLRHLVELLREVHSKRTFIS